jgi:hypothetical protein
MRRACVVLALSVACDAGPKAAPPPAPVAAARPIDAAVPDAAPDALDRDAQMRERMKPLKDLQASLGDKAIECEGTARILSEPGADSLGGQKQREARLFAMCTKDRWPLIVRECVATADHDPLSCTSHMTGRARTRFEAYFQSL